MPRPESVPFERLPECDLWVGARYEGGSEGHLGDEPIDPILHCGNMGGFRIRGSIQRNEVKLVALFTTLRDRDWPDRIDEAEGQFIYYGDNKTPGQALHETPKHGNELLRRSFDALHIPGRPRSIIPPFFVFSKTGPGRSVRFHGVAVPGGPELSEAEDLVAIWKTKGATRFQNYRAIFSILDIDPVPRSWIEQLLSGEALGPHCPDAWRQWAEDGRYVVLRRGSGR